MRLGARLAALILLLIAAIGLSHGMAPGAGADILTPGLDFSLEVVGVTGCNTSQGEATCVLTPGGEFTVNVNLGPLPSDIPNYAGFDIFITYQGVAPQGLPSTSVWPDCAFPALGPPERGALLFGCAMGIPPAGPSTYAGTIGTLQVRCTQAGSIVLHNGTDDTDLVEYDGSIRLDPRPLETLNLSCGSALARFPDANCDGRANSVDALLILQWSADLLDRLPCPEAADANGDGVADAVDAALILQAEAGLLALPPPPAAPAGHTDLRIANARRGRGERVLMLADVADLRRVRRS